MYIFWIQVGVKEIHVNITTKDICSTTTESECHTNHQVLDTRLQYTSSVSLSNMFWDIKTGLSKVGGRIVFIRFSSPYTWWLARCNTFWATGGSGIFSRMHVSGTTGILWISDNIRKTTGSWYHGIHSKIKLRQGGNAVLVAAVEGQWWQWIVLLASLWFHVML